MCQPDPGPITPCAPQRLQHIEGIREAWADRFDNTALLGMFSSQWATMCCSASLNGTRRFSGSDDDYDVPPSAVVRTILAKARTVVHRDAMAVQVRRKEKGRWVCLVPSLGIGGAIAMVACTHMLDMCAPPPWSSLAGSECHTVGRWLRPDWQQHAPRCGRQHAPHWGLFKRAQQ